MNQILDRIVESKKREVRCKKQERPLSELLSVIQGLPAPRLFFEDLIHEKAVAIIAEIKRASPSAGILRQDFDPVSIAKTYKKNGARAISILTEEKYFNGKLSYLNQVRKEVNLPLLRKDFVLDPYQVVEARAAGADAVLLILSILSKEQGFELVVTTREFKLDLLVEVHTAEELQRALSYGCRVIGINNRNLTTFEVDLNTTERLFSAIPKEVVVISESGIKQKQDVEKLGQLGVDAVLIGETLMRQKDVGAALRQFSGVPKWSR
jgi:indole-3-glycerol phosphate synthase